MKLNRNEHSRFVQRLDRTAEKNLLLWLPCVLLIALALAGGHIAEYLKIVYSHRNTEKIVKEKPQLERKPLALRAVAMSLVVAFVFMFTADVGQAVYADEYFDSENNTAIIDTDTTENAFDDGFDSERESNYTDLPVDVDTVENTDENAFKAYSDSDLTYGDFNYTISNGEVTITGYKGSDTEVVIPDTIEGMPVISIGTDAFRNCINLTSIIIPNGVTHIGNGAFAHCENASNINIPDGVIEIDDYAFCHCQKLTIVNIPNSVTKIGINAFINCISINKLSISNNISELDWNVFSLCSSLKEVTIPNGVKKIGINAFYKCTNLKKVIIPDSVNVIERNAFYGCSSLTSVTIPDSVTSIGDNAFEGCTSLTIYGVPGSYAETYANENGILFVEIDDNVVNFVGGDGSVENPYQIATAEQLDAVRYNLSANYIQIANIDLSIYDSWIPIGSEFDENNDPITFNGTYDGQNYTISGLTITSPNYRFIGLFGHLNSASALISNIKLSDININLDMQSIDYENNGNDGYVLCVGAIAGRASTNYHSGCSITNCEATGSINVINSYDAYIGGIVGYGDASNSINRSNIFVNSNRIYDIWKSCLHVGGIIGHPEAVNSEITNCINYGNIKAIASGTLFGGGICGQYGGISYSINYGDIKGESYGTGRLSANDTNIGGIVGATSSDDNHHVVNYGNLESYAYGYNDEYSTGHANAGGIVGYIGYQNSGKLQDSYNLCKYIICQGSKESSTHVGRIAAYTGWYLGECYIANNYSMETTLINETIPTENIGHDQINGESLSKEEIEKAIEDIINGNDKPIIPEIPEQQTITSENGMLSYTGYMKDGNLHPDFKQYSINYLKIKVSDNIPYTASDVTWSVNSNIIEIGYTNTYEQSAKCYFIAWKEGSAVITATLPNGEKIDMPIVVKGDGLVVEVTATTKRSFSTSANTEFYNDPIEIGFNLYISCPTIPLLNDNVSHEEYINYENLYNKLLQNLPTRTIDKIKFTLPEGFTFEDKTSVNEFSQIIPLKTGQKVTIWAMQKVNMDIYPIIPENKKANYYKFNADVTIDGKIYSSTGHITVNNCDYISKKTQDNSKDKVESTPKNSVGSAFENTYRSHIKGNDSASKQIRGSFSYLREAIAPEAFNKIAADTLMFCDLQMMESVSSENNQLKEIFGYEGLKAKATWNINKKALLIFKDIPDRTQKKTYTIYVQFQTTGSALGSAGAAYCKATAYIDIGNHKVVECGTYVTTYENLSSLNSDLRDIYNKTTHVGDYAYWIRLGIKDYCGITGLKKANEISDFMYTLYCNVKNPSLPKFELNSLSDITKLFKEVINPNSNTNKILNIKCPVDVEILGSDGSVVGAIRDNKVVVSSDDVKMSVNGDEKIVKLYFSDEYSIVLSGTDSGTMEYVVSEYVDGENVRTVTFEDIPLSESSVYTGEVDELIFQDESCYSLTSETGEIINPDSDTYIFGEPINVYSVKFPEKIVVQRDSEILINDEIIQPGDVLTISASDNTVESILVNDYSFNNGSNYTVGESDINISVTIKEDKTHTHIYGENWIHNQKSHWYECECGKRILEAQHTKSRGVVTVPADTETDGIRTYFCSICGAIVETEIIPAISSNHNCSFNVDWSSNSYEHWQECVCGARENTGIHNDNGGVTVVEPTETSNGISVHSCTVCGYIMRMESIPALTGEHIHSFDTHWHTDNTSHWHECTICGTHADTERHNENNAVVTVQPTATTAGIRTYYCSVCGYAVRTETIPPINDPNPPYPTYPTYPTITYPTNTDTNTIVSNEPYIYGDTLKSGWEAIISEIDFTADGSTVMVNMNGTYELPQNVVLHIQNRNINLELNMGSAVWTINGLDVTNPQTVNMRVSDRYNKIPTSVIDGLNSELEPKEYRLYHSGDFGFKATLTLNVGKRYTDYYAALYHYNTKTKQPEFIDESLVENRLVTFELTHASYYAVAFNSVPMYDDVSASAGVFENSVPIETSAMPETSGVTIPAIKLPQIMKYSNKKRRYRILKKRKLDDLVFVL